MPPDTLQDVRQKARSARLREPQDFTQKRVISVKANSVEELNFELRQKPIILAAMLFLLTILLYGQVAHYEFLVFDDGPYVTKNIHVNTGLSPANVVWAFTSYWEANWHPLTWISHMLDCQLFGLNPGPPHVVNVALHALNAVLLFLLLQRAAGAVWRSFFVAALFAVHPLNVESVAWVAQRKSLLCTFLCLVTIAAYGWYVRKPSWQRYLLIAAGFLLALMSKPMAVTLPLVLLLLDYWPLERDKKWPFGVNTWLRLAREKLPLCLLAGASSWVTVLAQRAGGAVAEDTALPLNLRLGNAIVSYVAYMGKTFWPANLSVFYPHPQHNLPWSYVLVCAIILIAITATVVYFHRTRYLATGWFLFVATLIPVIGIIQVGRQAMADRYAYIPCIGLFLIVAWGLNELSQAFAIPRPVPAFVALGLIFGFAATTVYYLPYWRNGVILFTRASEMAGRPDPSIEEALGDALTAVERYPDAFQHYRETCILRPRYAYCHYNMAEILYNRNQLEDALNQYQMAGRLTNDRDLALSCLINSSEILLKLGDFPDAEREIAGALQIDRGNRAALKLREQLLQQSGRQP